MDSEQDDTSYNFLELSKQYTYLKPFLKTGGGYNFSYEGQCALTKAILKHQYDIEFTTSPGNLCPPIPSKVAYLKIINTVLNESGCLTSDPLRKSVDVVWGVDIGTGAYAIYPILGHKIFNWHMVGVDIDDHSLKHAQQMLEVNGLNGKIQLLKHEEYKEHNYTFMMCNPPFYDSNSISNPDEDVPPPPLKEPLDRQSVIATTNELSTEGGEVKFVSDLIETSGTLNIIWFSSMLGKKSSLDPLLSKLNELHCPNYFIRDYQLGKTKRWILFWSFKLYRPIVYNSYKQIQPTVVEFHINLDEVKPILEKLKLTSLKRIEEEDGEDSIEVVTDGDVWSRSYRRGNRKSNQTSESKFIITKNQIHWAYGKHSAVFQSFHTLIRKQTRK